ncbi:MAG: DUF1343 domain-containing protein, partial [Candidatus Methanomethylicia archaeon]
MKKANEILKYYRNCRVGLLINQASFVQPDFIFSLDYLKNLGFNITKILAPQHGLFPLEQANMIPSKSYYDSIFNIPVISLYEGDYLVNKEKLEDIDVVFVDIQDVGARYYTYVWTVKLICDTGIDVVIFNRPNPLGGKKEGV